ncbi:hypothetical protein [Roseofilum sp. Guam]|uniref:hypothetical protein n=1 Tax=Roseofilum sp. Guam TaxID=2821502 RepID=UPI001B20D5D4|nr:hypothetical protein [Roseofilum sp. Guam]MBP0028627.1 hypothetical protein [Roseofilum sp. Guam]
MKACRRLSPSSSVPLSIEETRGLESASRRGTDVYHFLKDVGQGFSGTTVRLITEDSPFEESANSQISGKVAVAPCPQAIALRPESACGFGEVPGVSRQGGSSLALSRYSKNRDAAWVFLQWLTSADTMTRAALLSKTNSVRRSTYSDPRLKMGFGANPQVANYFEVTLDAIENRMGTEPHHSNWIEVGFDRFPMELGKLMTNQQSIRTTLNNMAQAAARATETL